MIREFQNNLQAGIEKFSTELPAAPAELYEPVRYMLSLGGKRIRPLFVLMAHDLFERGPEKAMPAALAVELFHNFTLVHDDIMDNAPLRRGKPSVHCKWNIPTAILSGDVMLVQAYQQLGKTKWAAGTLEKVLHTFSEMAAGVCEGQQLDLQYEQLHRISIPQYFKMTELKTSVLIAASMKMGAQAGGAGDEDAKNLYEFGRCTGLAFQLQDDLLDVYGDEEKFGKQKGGDILANKKTFLLLKALEMAANNHYLKEELEQWVGVRTNSDNDSSEKIKAVTRIFDFVNVRKVAEEEINSYHKKALSYLEKVTASAEKKKMLAAFTASLLARQS